MFAAEQLPCSMWFHSQLCYGAINGKKKKKNTCIKPDMDSGIWSDTAVHNSEDEVAHYESRVVFYLSNRNLFHSVCASV